MFRWSPLFLLLIGIGIFHCTPIKTILHYEQALKAYQNGQDGEAEIHLHRALQENPDDEKSLSLQAWVYYRRGRTEEASRLFERANLLNSKNLSTIEGLAWIYYGRGQEKESKAKFNQMIQYSEKHLRNPNWAEYPLSQQEYVTSIHSDASYGLGLIAKRNGKWDLARIHLERALNQHNRFILPETIRWDLAETLFNLQQYGGAMIHYRELLSQNPSNYFLLNRYAWCLYQMGKMEQSKSAFLLSRDLVSSRVKFYQGSSPLQSITEKLKAKRIAEAYYGLALIYAKERKPKAAAHELLFALSLSPFFHHPDEIIRCFRGYPEWQTLSRPRF